MKSPGARRTASVDGLSDDWERPRPALRDCRSDVLVTVVAALLGLFLFELWRSAGSMEGATWPTWSHYAITGLSSLAFITRRAYPTVTAAVFSVVFFAIAFTETPLAQSVFFQLAAPILMFSALAWGANRRLVWALAISISVGMLVWATWDLINSHYLTNVRESFGAETYGFIEPATAAVAFVYVMTAFYFAAAMGLGQLAWRSARREAVLREQSHTIEEQARHLQRQAVTDERLRIARELHDVVAHHVAVIGVQAGAARRIMTKNPDAAATALRSVEQSSRDAVGEMRSLLGTLRADEDGNDSREPGPSLAALEDLIDKARTPTMALDLHLVENPKGAVADLPSTVSLTLYRVVQEALSNVRKHSTATRVNIVVRADRDAGYAEAEVVDNGRSKKGTGGTGLGLRGMAERAAALAGDIEVGPRAVGGYRVRMRLPWNA